MKLSRALRINSHSRLALVGAGGKTAALFQLARQLPPPVIVTASTHLAVHQLGMADRHITIDSPSDFDHLVDGQLAGITLFTGPLREDGRTSGLDETSLHKLHRIAERRGLALLIEADGSRQRPLKAPAAHEPAVPKFVDTVIVVVGLSALGKPLDADTVHRPELFGSLAGLQPGENISSECLVRVLLHPLGGLKGILETARRLVLLNQVDDMDLEKQARQLAGDLLPVYSTVAAACLASPDPEGQVLWARGPVAGVVLAAGGSKRYGQPKQLLPWEGEPLVHRAARLGLESGLNPVVVVTGFAAPDVRAALKDLPIKTITNRDWTAGQSTSVAAGIRALPPETRGAVFILADQPRMTTGLLDALVELHARTSAPIIAPRVKGQRANPVLFDSAIFPHLLELEGDVGGRIFFSPGSPYQPTWLEWEDPGLLLDIDTPEDYLTLLKMEEQA